MRRRCLTWTLKDTLGEELDVLDEPVEFCWVADLLPVIEAAPARHTRRHRKCRSNLSRPLATSTTSCCSWSHATSSPMNWKKA